MSRRKSKPKKLAESKERTSVPKSGQSPMARATREASENVNTGNQPLPSAAFRAGLSVWVSLHLVALLISFTGVVEPSSLHAGLLSLVHPYLRATHFSADDRPVYLAHGDRDEQPHRVQITDQPISESQPSVDVDWVNTGPGELAGATNYAGLAVSDRVARWLATAAMLADNDQPSMVADLLLPLVESDTNIQAIRIVRFPTDLSDINSEIETPYVARVLRDGNSVALVQLKESRLSATPVTNDIRTGQGDPILIEAIGGSRKPNDASATLGETP